MPISKIKAGSITGTFDTSKIGSGTFADARIAASNVSQHATTYDDNALQSKVALLGFKNATVGSLAAYNLTNQSIDEFVDNSKIDTGNSTNETLQSGEYYGGTAGSPTGGNSTGSYSYGGTTYQFSKFTSSGTFTAPSAGVIDVFVLAGGGSSVGDNGGGGGAGGLVWKESLSISSGAHTVTVGDGGTGTAAGSESSSNQGGDSLFGSYITAKGGGYGGAANGLHGTDGGSGGGAGRNYGGGGSNPGSATQPSQSGNSAGLGNAGGAGRADSEGPGGGGGGAGAAGGAGTSGTVGNGGEGSSTFISSSAAATTAFLLGTTSGTDSSNAATTGSSSGTLYIAGGGSGGTQDRSEHSSGGNGGLGGGAAIGGSSNGNNGLANTGGGGSGTTTGSGTGGNGGSGLVIVRYTSTTFQQAGQNLTLQSQAVTANSQPSSADLIMLIKNNAGTATINTDIKGYVSRDNGSTYTQGTLVDEGTYDTNVKILAVHDLDISSQPSGTQMKYKIETLNQSAGSKETFIQAVSLGWK